MTGGSSPRIVAELTSLDIHLAGYIARAIRDFSIAEKGTPGGLTAEEWRAHLDEIADGFDLYVSVEGQIDAPDLQARFDRAFDLLRDHWGHLWL